MKKQACYALAGLMMLASCSEEEKPRVDRVNATVDNPTVYLYVEDADGNDLMAAGLPVSVILPDVGQRLDYQLIPAGEKELPWGGQGALLTITPPQPYHLPFDGEYVYTLDPWAQITIGDNHPFTLQRVFGCDLHRHDLGDEGKVVDVNYTPLRTLVAGGALQGDTAHIIFDGEWPYLRVEGPELTLEMLFPLADDEQAGRASQPFVKDDEDRWDNGFMQMRLLMAGMAIARPYEHVSTTVLQQEHLVKMVVSLRLPCIFSSNNYQSLNNYMYHFLVSCPDIFGSDGEHSVELQLYSYGRGEPHLTDMDIDYIYQEPQYTDPTHIVVDWRNWLHSNDL